MRQLEEHVWKAWQKKKGDEKKGKISDISPVQHANLGCSE